jgi:hypothetical protein
MLHQDKHNPEGSDVPKRTREHDQNDSEVVLGKNKVKKILFC